MSVSEAGAESLEGIDATLSSKSIVCMSNTGGDRGMVLYSKCYKL